MLRLEDCIGLCGLTEEEVRAVADHEHLTDMAAAELGSYLLSSPDGELRIKAMIRDDIAEAERRGDRLRALMLRLVLRSFVLNHPRCDERWRAQLRLPDRRGGST
jgi:hypothetical protein